jgi:hypothetical protein
MFVPLTPATTSSATHPVLGHNRSQKVTPRIVTRPVFQNEPPLLTLLPIPGMPFCQTNSHPPTIHP